MLVAAFSPFSAMFSKGFFPKGIKSHHCMVKEMAEKVGLRPVSSTFGYMRKCLAMNSILYFSC